MATPCDLCQLDVGEKPFTLNTKEGVKVFCCEACLGIYQMLHGDDEEADSEPEKPA